MLYIVATPIGNLKDITLRALEVLKQCDYILAEDTRKSRILLKHYKIDTPTTSYHKFNERKKMDKTIRDLKNDKNIALISDAGTPTISDPGCRIIAECKKHNIPITAIPGPSSLTTALSLSGYLSSRFQFVGFLPRKKQKLINYIQQICDYPGVTIAFESPKRLFSLLKILQENFPAISLCVARELTKKFEEIVEGTPEKILTHFSQKSSIKGEITLLFFPS